MMVYGGETDDGADDSLWSFNTTSFLWNKVTCPKEAFKGWGYTEIGAYSFFHCPKSYTILLKNVHSSLQFFFLPSISAPWIKITSFRIYCVGVRCTKRATLQLEDEGRTVWRECFLFVFFVFLVSLWAELKHLAFIFFSTCDTFSDSTSSKL